MPVVSEVGLWVKNLLAMANEAVVWERKTCDSPTFPKAYKFPNKT